MNKKTINNSNIISKNAQIREFTIIENDCIIKDNAIIGPFAHVHNHSYIGENSIIGNFVEVNRSIIHNSVKIKHLSYIGDATINDNTNIGAGVIFCNYDGNNKNEIIVGKNCFIGSNCVLIAPLIIEDNCFVGANSVVTQNLTKNTFFVSKREFKTSLNKFVKLNKL